MPTKTIRFVLGTEELHSLSWKMVVQTRDDGAEIYIMPREISNDYHVSLHKSGAWHVRVGAREARERGYEPHELTGPSWNRPAELSPGVTLAVRMVVTPSAISRTHRVARSSSCSFIPPPSQENSVEVSVVITSAAPSSESWVGKDAMGTELLGWCPMGDEFVSIVWREVATPQPRSIPLSMAAAKPLTGQLPEESSVVMMLWMLDENGTPALLLGRFDDESAARFRERWNEVHGA